MEENSQHKSHIRRYVLVYYTPEDGMSYVQLNATTLKEASTVAKLVFGASGLRRLYYRKIPISS